MVKRFLKLLLTGEVNSKNN